MLTLLIWLLIALFTIAVYAMSWGIACFIIYLITICFGWTFSLAVATGIWLIMIMILSMFKPNKYGSK